MTVISDILLCAEHSDRQERSVTVHLSQTLIISLPVDVFPSGFMEQKGVGWGESNAFRPNVSPDCPHKTTMCTDLLTENKQQTNEV